MALPSLFFVLVQRLIQFPQPAGDGLDEATHQRMRERQELLDREMARLLQELEQQDEGWGAMLFGALQQWPFWVLAGILLLLGLWLGCRRRSCEASSSSKDQSSCKTLADETVTEQEEDTADPEEGGEDSDMALEADDSGTENDREGRPVAAGNYDVKVKEDGDVNSGNYDAKEDSHVNDGNGYELKKEGQSDGDVPGDTTTEGDEEEPGSVAGNELDEAMKKTRMFRWIKKGFWKGKGRRKSRKKPIVQL
nr:uncharacterized protein LOC115498373 isoform X2 [Taeniopygia guttata]